MHFAQKATISFMKLAVYLQTCSVTQNDVSLDVYFNFPMESRGIIFRPGLETWHFNISSCFLEVVAVVRVKKKTSMICRLFQYTDSFLQTPVTQPISHN